MKIQSLGVLLGLQATLGSMIIKEEKAAEWASYASRGLMKHNKKTVRNEPQACVNGEVVIDGESFGCDNVDFLSYVSLPDMEIDNPQGHQATGIAGADIWGWLSPSGREITLMCQDNGISVFDTTVPEDPCLIAQVPSKRRPDAWCDVKVYKDTAYIVKDSRGGDFANDTTIGGQVLDLLRLEDLTCDGSMDLPVYLEEDYLWRFHGSAHNVAVNTETGFMYSMGSDYCSGGLIVADLNQNRLRPEFVHCIDGDGYTHDVQCVVYDGPDTRYTGREICFAFNEEKMTVWDVTYKYSPAILSTIGYPSQVYCHQGWVNGDMTMVLLDDELNERCSGPAPGNESTSCTRFPQGPLDGETRTSTIVMDITDLTNPTYTGRYLHEELSIDHNLYYWGNTHRKGWGGNPPMEYPPDERFAYLNNYVAGVKILDTSSKDPATFTQVGYFDVAPDLEELVYLGAWSAYMHPSGALAVSSIDRGLFMLKPLMAFEQSVRNPLAFPSAAPIGTPDETDEDDDSVTEESFVLGVAVIVCLLMVILMFMASSALRPSSSNGSTLVVEKKSSL